MTLRKSIYDVCFADHRIHPHEGGCLAIAQALQEVLGGEIRIIATERGGIGHHAVVEIDGEIVDMDGRRSMEDAIRLWSTEIGEPARLRSFRPRADLPDAIRSPELIGKLSTLFRNDPDLLGNLGKRDCLWMDEDPQAETRLLDDLNFRTVFRGQHGPGKSLETRLGTIAFGSEHAATAYATSPNDIREAVIEPKIFEARLRPLKPFAFSDPKFVDPFIDLAQIDAFFPAEVVEAIIRDCRGSIENTSSFQEMHERTGLAIDEMLDAYRDGRLRDLPIVEAWEAIEVPEMHQALINKGVDLVVIGGTGTTACEVEYHVLDRDIIEIVGVHAPENREETSPHP